MYELLPPLQINGNNTLFDKRDVNTRWLIGTVLTGFVGFLLMGGALFSASNGVFLYANMPTIAKLKPNLIENNIRKSDKLSPLSYSPVTRQVINVQTRQKENDKEIVKTKNFIRLSAPLALTRTQISQNLPSMSALSLATSEAPKFTNTQINTIDKDAEVSITYYDFFSVLTDEKSLNFADQSFNIQEIIAAQLLSTTELNIPTIASATLVPPPTSDFFIAQSIANQSAANNIGVKITETNISAVSKDTSDPFKLSIGDEKTVIVTNGVSLVDILLRQGMQAKEAGVLAQTIMNRLPVGSWKEGLKIQIFTGSNLLENNMMPEKLRVLADETVLAVAVQSDLGHYVMIDEQEDDNDYPSDSSIITQFNKNNIDQEADKKISLYHALFETGVKNGVPKSVLTEFVRIASFDLDFERKIVQGDTIEFFYADEDLNPKTTIAPEILYSAITLNGESRRFYRFEAPDDKTIDYYDETGKSAKRFLIRKPMSVGEFRSGFGSRRHPILGYTRMHTGVDWSAPHGTPILAAGNGIVQTAGREAGYGNYVLIKHINGYETGYAHLTAFAKGITEGVKVRQGQVIGYVGSTGQSTGNHLHYEVIVNGRFVDPLRIKIPQGRVLDVAIKAQFDKERERIDSLINRAPASTKVVNTL